MWFLKVLIFFLVFFSVVILYTLQILNKDKPRNFTKLLIVDLCALGLFILCVVAIS